MLLHLYTVVGIVGNAEIICLACFRRQYGTQVLIDLLEGQKIQDREGNNFEVYFYGDAIKYNDLGCYCCGNNMLDNL